MKRLILCGLAMILLSACAQHDLGYRNYPLPAAYYPRRYNVHLGPIRFIDIQIAKR